MTTEKMILGVTEVDLKGTGYNSKVVNVKLTTGKYRTVPRPTKETRKDTYPRVPSIYLKL